MKVDAGYDFNAPMGAGYQGAGGFDDTAFPERRLY